MSNIRQRYAVQADRYFDPSHPIAIGATVTILSLSRDKAPAIEGVAVIEAVAPGPHEYVVRFLSDSAARKRLVHHDYQENPHQFVEILRDLWRASNTPDFDEFFPDTSD